jgi:ferredoxin
MKYFVNDQCIGCGLCSETCPEVFSMTDEGVAEAIDEEVSEEYLDAAAEAMDDCPVSAIEQMNMDL